MGFYRAKGWKPLYEEMDEEAGALKMVMTKTLTKECRWCVDLERTCRKKAVR
ncbi:MAG: hypothetical protein ACYDHX_11935 [Methanothrix sp.]